MVAQDPLSGATESDPKGAVTESYRVASPRSPGFDAPPAVPADFAIRFGAQAIDVLVSMVVGFVAAIPATVIIMLLEHAGMTGRGALASAGNLTLTSFLLSAVGVAAYHAISESMGGATIGKWLCGLRVYGAKKSLDGVFLLGVRRCSLGAAVLRHLGLLIDGMFFGAIGYSTISNSPLRQRLGDRWAGTVVVRAKSMTTPPGSPALGVFLGLAASSACIALGILSSAL